MNYSRCINTALSALFLLASISLGAQDWVGKKHLSLGGAGVSAVRNSYYRDRDILFYGGDVQLAFAIDMFSFLETGIFSSLGQWRGEYFIGTVSHSGAIDPLFTDTFNTFYSSRTYWSNNLFIGYNFNKYFGFSAAFSFYNYDADVYQAKRDNQVVYSKKRKEHHFFNYYFFNIYGQYKAFRASLFFQKAFRDFYKATFGLRLSYRYSFE